MNYKDFRDNEIWTCDETACFLRVHRTTVTRYTLRGELPSYKIGNRRLLKKADVLAFFEKQLDR